MHENASKLRYLDPFQTIYIVIVHVTVHTTIERATKPYRVESIIESMGKNLQQFHSSYVIVPRVQRCYGVIGDETTEAISVEEARQQKVFLVSPSGISFFSRFKIRTSSRYITYRYCMLKTNTHKFHITTSTS